MRPVATFAPYPDTERLLAGFEAGMGLDPAIFAPYRFWQRTPRSSIWLTPADWQPPPVPMDAQGLLVLRDPPPHGRPTTVFALRFGHLATRGVIDLAPEHIQAVLSGQPIEISSEVGTGWHILRWRGRAFCWGWLALGQLRPELPTATLIDLDPTTA